MNIRHRATVILGLAVGTTLGLALYTFVYARGPSYLTNDPAACANCHVMQDQYTAWIKGPHHAVAVCNDCHTPRDTLGKYLAKATNGMSHSLAFTLGPVPDVIVIKARSRTVVEAACRSCHGALTMAVTGEHGQQDIACLRCHADVGHASAAPLPGGGLFVTSSASH